MKATPTEIAEWKKAWGRIHEVEIQSGEKTLLGYFRHPDINVILAASSKTNPATGEGGLDAGAVMYESLKLKVDPEIEKDDEAKIGCYTVLAGLFKIKQAQIKEL
jgi:hypothetical protein